MSMSPCHWPFYNHECTCSKYGYCHNYTAICCSNIQQNLKRNWKIANFLYEIELTTFHANYFILLILYKTVCNSGQVKKIWILLRLASSKSVYPHQSTTGQGTVTSLLKCWLMTTALVFNTISCPWEMLNYKFTVLQNIVLNINYSYMTLL
jgi:hypothetical protein